MIIYKWFLTLFLFASLAAFAQDPRVGDNYALVIIDMQPKFVTRGGNDKDPENIKKVEQIIENQKKMIEMAKAQGLPIIFIEYKSFGDTNSALKEAVKGYKGTKTFIKDTDGMLDSDNKNVKKLSKYLRSKEIGNLIITGANGGACVEESIRGSLANNYNVLAYPDGIADFNYPQFIYPYKNLYSFNPICESCSFREIGDEATMTLEVATKTQAPKKVVTENKNDSDRGQIKTVPERKTNSKPIKVEKTTQQ